MSLGDKIASLRKDKKISQVQLADYLNVSPQSVSRWETGNCYPDIELLPDIACFFGITIEELYGISAIKRVEQLVKKYSVIRSEASYEQAKRAVDNEKDNALAAQDLDVYNQLRLYELHLFIQRSREYISKASAAVDAILSEDNLDKDVYFTLQMQKIQLDVANGCGRQIRNKLKEQYHLNPTKDNLIMYVNVLTETFADEDIVNLLDMEQTRKILSEDKEVYLIWELILSAAYYLERLDIFEDYYAKDHEEPPVIVDTNIRMLYIDLLSKSGKREQAIAQKNICLEKLVKVDKEDYIIVDAINSVKSIIL